MWTRATDVVHVPINWLRFFTYNNVMAQGMLREERPNNRPNIHLLDPTPTRVVFWYSVRWPQTAERAEPPRHQRV